VRLRALRNATLVSDARAQAEGRAELEPVRARGLYGLLLACCADGGVGTRCKLLI
jgi:hypothetical protein